MRFLPNTELRAFSIPEETGFVPVGLALGNGVYALEIAVAEAKQRPTATLLRRTWHARNQGRVAPLLLVVLYNNQASVCGPTGPEPMFHSDLDAEQVERLCFTSLEKPDRHAATRFINAALPELESPLPGLHNEGFLATHELLHGVPRRADWEQAKTRAAPILYLRGRALIESLGFEISPLDGPLSVLIGHGTKVALAVFQYYPTILCF